MVDPAKIEVIINLEAPRSVKQLRTMLGHTGYYRKFIKAYDQIIMPMDKLLRKMLHSVGMKNVSIVWMS